MNTSIALSYILGMSTRGVKLSGRTLRCKLEAPTFGREQADTEAVKGLLLEGRSVRVLEKNTIWTPVLDKDGILVWEDTPARRDRTQVTVEVSL